MWQDVSVAHRDGIAKGLGTKLETQGLILLEVCVMQVGQWLSDV